MSWLDADSLSAKQPRGHRQAPLVEGIPRSVTTDLLEQADTRKGKFMPLPCERVRT